jgi:hypothetical protein
MLLVVLEGAISILMVVGKATDEYLPLPSVNDVYLSLPMYQDSPEAREYWDEFRLSSKQEYVDYLGWRRSDYRGKYINIVDGHRKTPTNVRQEGQVIAVFGGSTVWGTGVRDSETIPSWMASKIGGKFRVLNFGEAGYVAFQGLLSFYEALRDNQPIRHAIFYDGLNDAYSACVNPGRDWSTINFYQMKEKIEHQKGSGLRIVLLAKYINRYIRKPRSKMTYRCDDEQEASNAARVMVRTWSTIQDIADKSGVKSHFVLQPVSYVDNADVSYLEIDQTMASSFQNFYKYVDIHSREMGIIHYYNLSKIFSGTSARHYIDFAHVIGDANREIAEAIFSRMELQ